MNLGDYGTTYYFGTGFAGNGFDMSAYTDLILTFTAPDGVTTFNVDISDGVSLGNVNQTVRGGTFNARQYVIYRFTQGQITQAGTWRARLDYVQSTATPPISFNSGIGSFVVGS